MIVRPSASVTASPRWSAPRSGPIGIPSAGCRVRVEAAGPLCLHQRIADRGHAVVDGERDEAVVAAVTGLAGGDLDEAQRVREPPEDAAQRIEEVAEAPRPVDRDRQLAATQRERLQHSRQPEVVVGVVVREEHLGKVDETHGRPQELALRPLAAVEEQALAAAADEQRGGARRAVGAEAAVPRKTTSRSTARF